MTSLPDQERPPVVAAPLFILDYDGTLAEIVADPEAAYPHEAVPALLGRLARAHPVALLTGRAVRTLERLLPAPGLEAFGVHGLERGRLGGEVRDLTGPAAARALAGVRARLPELVAAPELEGLLVEDKGNALALHYRRAPDRDAALARLRAWAEGRPAELTALWGKLVLELRPAGRGKGVAAAELAAEHPLLTPVVIGDDATDEEAFVALPHGVTVKVGPGASAAAYRLPGVGAVVDYLRAYL